MRTFIYTSGDPQSHKEAGRKLQELPLTKDGKGIDYAIVIKQNRPVRSLSSNKYYHAVLNIIAIHTGHDHDFLHDEMKRKFNSETVFFPKSGTVIKPKSTADLDTKEFGAFVNRVKLWAMDEFSIVIPEPEDVTYQRWMEIQNEYSRAFSGY